MLGGKRTGMGIRTEHIADRVNISTTLCWLHCLDLTWAIEPTEYYILTSFDVMHATYYALGTKKTSQITQSFLVIAQHGKCMTSLLYG
jgi:hypothetical protein